MSRPDVEIDHPQVSDADGIYQLVRDSKVLDVNSRYAYLMWCERFGATSLVVRSKQRSSSILGFVLGFVPPARPSTLFVWQVAISKQLRGCGLGLELLQRLLRCDGCFEMDFVEAHVGESNEPSARLFRSLARKNEAELSIHTGFSSELFGSSDHESERLFRIGPLTLS